MSPKRGDVDHTLSLEIPGNQNANVGSVLTFHFNSAGFADGLPVVMVNRGIFNPFGLDSILLDYLEVLPLEPLTMLNFVDSSYSWQIADPTVARIFSNATGQVEIEALSVGETTLTLTDVPNDALIPGYYVSMIPVVVSNLFVDVDADGLPVSFEQLIVNASGGAITNVAQVNPDDDFDGDGQSNQEEYIAGVDPTDPASIFAVTPPQPLPGGFVISWNAVQGRLYDVYWATNLMSGFQVLQLNIPYPVNSYTDTVHSANSVGNYKVDVKLQ